MSFTSILLDLMNKESKPDGRFIRKASPMEGVNKESLMEGDLLITA